jgi:sugar porter (SP) family MFS transporter
MAEDTTSRSENKFFLYISVVIASFGGFLFGYDTAVISGAILYIKQQLSLSSGMEEVVISSLFLSAMVGALLGGTLADRIGRRKVMIAAGVLFCAGSTLMAVAPSVSILILGRIITGISLGMVSVTAPIYISEISMAAVRGRMVTLNTLAITLGTLLAYLVDYFFSFSKSWRWMFGLEVIPALILIIGMLWLTETPRWLMGHSLKERAREALTRLRGRKDVDEELSSLASGADTHGGGWSDLLSPAIRPALLLGVGLAFLRALAGFSIILYGYSPTIVEFAGFESASIAILATVGVGVVNTIMSAVAITLIDRVGRRPLMVFGLAGITISLGVLGIAFLYPSSEGFVRWMAVGGLLIYIGMWSLGPRPVFWVLIAEIYPLKVRGKAMSLGALTNWGTTCLVTLTFLTLTNLIGVSGTFWLYGLFAILTMLLFYFFIPETKGQKLEDIQKEWRQKKAETN